MKKLILIFLTISNMGVFSIHADCDCRGDAEQCSCKECNCPSCSDSREQMEEQNYVE